MLVALLAFSLNVLASDGPSVQCGDCGSCDCSPLAKQVEFLEHGVAHKLNDIKRACDKDNNCKIVHVHADDDDDSDSSSSSSSSSYEDDDDSSSSSSSSFSTSDLHEAKRESPCATEHVSRPLNRHDVLDAYKLPAESATVKHCDVVIGGLGTAGALLVKRFATTFPSLHICALDIGRDEARNPETTTCPINETTGLLVEKQTCRDWGVGVRYPLTTSPTDPNKCFSHQYESGSSSSDAAYDGRGSSIQGATWGGSASVNAQAYFRGTCRGYWDHVEDLVDDSEWSCAKVIESFKRIENRRQRTVRTYPSVLLPGVELARSFSADGSAPYYTPGASSYLDPTVHSAYPGELPLDLGGVVIAGPNNEVYEQAYKLFPGRFASESMCNGTAEYACVSHPDIDQDETVHVSVGTRVDQSAALLGLRVSTSQTAMGDALRAAIEAKAPDMFDFFRYAKNTPGPTKVLVDWLRSQGSAINETYSQVVAFPYMDLAGTTPSKLNTRQLFTPATPAGGVLHFEVARGNPTASFVNELLGRSLADDDAPEPGNDQDSVGNVEIISSAMIKRVVFEDEIRADGDPRRAVGFEYFPDAFDANRVGRSVLSDLCSRESAGAAADRVTEAPSHRIYARYDTILSTGVYATPAILQRSGVARRDDLESIEDRIPLRVDLSGVGHKLRNHGDVNMRWRNNILPAVAAATAPLLGPAGTLRSRSSPKLPTSDFHSIFLVGVPLSASTATNTTWTNFVLGRTIVPGRATIDRRLYPTGDTRQYSTAEVSQVLVEHMVSKSEGSVVIVSADPTVPPVIAENLNGNEEDIDAFTNHIQFTLVPLIESLANVTTRIVDFCVSQANQSPHPCDASNTADQPVARTRQSSRGAHFTEWLSPSFDELYSPDIDYDTLNIGNPTNPATWTNPTKMVLDRGKIRKYVEKALFHGWHGTGTASMGRADDCEAVVDQRLRVYDVKALRVVDASTHPMSPDVNSMGPTYGLAQRAFELMCAEYRTSLGVAAALDCEPSTDGYTLPEFNHAQVAATSTMPDAHIDTLVSPLGEIAGYV